MFLGANDSFPMGDIACCNNEPGSPSTRAALADDGESYGRGGQARVYWLLLPTPRGGVFRETFPAVNAGIVAPRSRPAATSA